MRRLILLLALAVSPVYAIGFWGSLGGGLKVGGFGEVRVTEDGNTVTFKTSPKGFIAGMNLMGGVSLQPIPIAVGLGVDYYAGTQKYEFDFWSIIKVEDTLEVKRTYIKLPVAYQLSLPMLKGYFGIYPAYATYSMYSMKGKGELDSTSYWMKEKGEPDTARIDFKDFAFGGFTNLYYSLGPVGIGGGMIRYSIMG
jgi:hypothetical protein